MYHPTSRVLMVLDVLQSRGTVRAADLAARLEVDVRTVRRYVSMLQDIGIPVEGRPGLHGGYRLRPGFRLPRLMLANDEALAVTLGLLFGRQFGLAGAAPATEGALAKIERVLPVTLRSQVRALADALVLDRPNAPLPGTPRPPIPRPATLLAIAAGASEERRLTLTYRDQRGVATTRPFDPYAVVYLKNGAWYTAGYCHLRGDLRVFRLDRVVGAEPEGTPFTRPADFDSLAYVQRSFARLPAGWSAEIAIDAPAEEARRWVTPLFAVVTEEAGEVIVRCSAMDIDWLARALVALPFEFRVRRPPELVAALTKVRDGINRTIAASGPPHRRSVEASAGLKSALSPEKSSLD
ncbi:MAG: YafY family transcriptional regulator [Chloroflexota bacterium]|nr:YafY family transcriptional regulator [Chloroflexota bacterium]